MAKGKKPIIFNNFQSGIGSSPLTGYADMRNVDIDSIPGVLMCGKKSLPRYVLNTAGAAFTANPDTDVITFAGDELRQYVGNSTQTYATAGVYGAAVLLTTTGTLPAGLSAGTVYYVRATGTTKQYKLSTTFANAVAETYVDITDAGTGTHTMTVIQMGKIQHWAKLTTNYASNGNSVVGLDNNNRLWYWPGLDRAPYLLPGNTLTNGSGNGLAAWKNYVLVFRDTNMDILDASTEGKIQASAANWINDWNGAFNVSVSNHYAMVGQDDIIYYCNDTNVGSIKQNLGQTFDPSNSGTYTPNASALDIPDNDSCTFIGELGTNLMVGTDSGMVYPWDRTSSTFKIPISFEGPIVSTVTHNNLMYVFAGRDGDIFFTDGTNSRKFASLPKYLTKSYLNSSSNAVLFGNAVYQDGKILFGAAVTDIDAVWSIDPQTRVLQIISLNSSGAYISGVPVANQQPIVVSLSDRVIAYSWLGDSSNFGVDSIGETVYYNNFEAYIETPIMQVGTEASKRSFSTMEIQLAEPMVDASTQGVQVSYRTNTNGSWTALDLFDESGYDKATSIILKADTGEVTQIQFKIALKESTTSSSLMKIKQIRLI